MPNKKGNKKVNKKINYNNDDLTFDNVTNNLNKKSSSDFKFIPLGGFQGVTMSCYAYCYKDEWLIVDCGILMDNTLTTDRIVPDLSILKDKKIVGFVLTHWHEDHLGAIAHYVKEYFSNCPIYASPLGILKIQSSIEDQLGVSSDLKPKYVTIKPEGETVKVGSFELKFIHSTHLTLQSYMVAIRTPVGTVLHTGDWSFSPAPLLEPRTDFDSLKALNNENFLCVVGDSTEVYRKTEAWGEDTVKENLYKAMGQYKRKLFITLFSSSLARMQSIYDNATKLGRKVCYIGRSINTNVEIAKKAGFLTKCNFITQEEASKLKDNEVCYIMTGCQGEPLAAMNKLLNDNIKSLSLNKDDAVIFSSSIIPGNEKDVLYLYGKIIDKDANLFTVNDNPMIHAHGHAGYSEFLEFFKLCKPKALLPMHGDKLSQFLHMKLARDCGVPTSFMLNNGDVVAFYKDKAPEIIEKIEVGALVIEGNRVLSTSDAVFRNRKKAFYDGVVFATISIDKKGFLKDTPQVSSVGVFETEETGMMKRQIEVSIVSELKNLDKSSQRSPEGLNQAISTGVRKVLRDFSDKKPKIVIHYVYK